MIDDNIIKIIQKTVTDKVVQIVQLSGGDTNSVYKVTCVKNTYVLKINLSHAIKNVFQSEVDGLSTIRKTRTFITPSILTTGVYNKISYLILEYVESGSKSHSFWIRFWQNLAKLHITSQPNFGYHQDNSIGSLPQYNKPISDWGTFYITQRLQPQFTWAESKGYIFSDKEKLFQWIENNTAPEKPSLIHGDLWSGNLLVTSDASPCLIDPAVCFASREMDIAMMKLFGGFDFSAMDSYEEIYPLAIGWERRIPLYQFYYVLVHLNIFGDAYYNQVIEIIDYYTQS
ncbi:fructosamine kinase family protein [Aquimarina intermedia]|uniref:Fructosamine-3-kinase n=1 Tax=Aquimarina intermedia TaxID=350814 RepID=A0A5S5C9F0_9FLAO|nr:fructosamine kinase family protein [Aquimarina intermedia]TYP75927.1 hypothetical protein BD809_102138 [Aquimarina intermedia]